MNPRCLATRDLIVASNAFSVPTRASRVSSELGEGGDGGINPGLGAAGLGRGARGFVAARLFVAAGCTSGWSSMVRSMTTGP
eukprot:1921685-Rhodomonas_salina.1